MTIPAYPPTMKQAQFAQDAQITAVQQIDNELGAALTSFSGLLHACEDAYTKTKWAYQTTKKYTNVNDALKDFDTDFNQRLASLDDAITAIEKGLPVAGNSFKEILQAQNSLNKAAQLAVTAASKQLTTIKTETGKLGAALVKFKTESKQDLAKTIEAAIKKEAEEAKKSQDEQKKKDEWEKSKTDRTLALHDLKELIVKLKPCEKDPILVGKEKLWVELHKFKSLKVGPLEEKWGVVPKGTYTRWDALLKPITSVAVEKKDAKVLTKERMTKLYSEANSLMPHLTTMH